MKTRTKEARGGKAMGPGRGTATARTSTEDETAPARQGAGATDPADEAPGAAHLPKEPIVSAIPIAEIYIPNGDGRIDRTTIGFLSETMRGGLLNPVTVRLKPTKQGRYELVAGRRRLAAASVLGWTAIPAIALEMSDVNAQVARIVENEQREDIHPLDQAECYRDLGKVGGLSIHKIARRVGRPESHVYDRLRLLDLTPEAQKLFRTGKIGVGHAIILSRLSAKDQARALEIPENRSLSGALFRHEAGTLWGENDEEEARVREDPLHGLTARTAVELQDWVDHHVRLNREAPDLPQLFPATAAHLIAADEKRDKVIPITHTYHVDPEAKDGKERTFGPMSWKRADGSDKNSKACEKSGIGVVVVGPRRGESFRVCVHKECPVHWGKEAKEARARKKAAVSGNATREANLEKARAAREAKEEQERARWKKAMPAIVEAFARAIAKASTKPAGYLCKYLMSEAGRRAKNLAPGKDADSLVRWLMLQSVADKASNVYWAPRELRPIASALGVDLKKILDAEAPVKKAEGGGE